MTRHLPSDGRVYEPAEGVRPRIGCGRLRKSLGASSPRASRDSPIEHKEDDGSRGRHPPPVLTRSSELETYFFSLRSFSCALLRMGAACGSGRLALASRS